MTLQLFKIEIQRIKAQNKFDILAKEHQVAAPSP